MAEVVRVVDDGIWVEQLGNELFIGNALVRAIVEYAAAQAASADGVRDAKPEPMRYEITSLVTLQFGVSKGIHLVRVARTGTPGPTLCDIDRFDRESPGWSLSGGVSNKYAFACPRCVAVADRDYPGLPVNDGIFQHLFDRPRTTHGREAAVIAIPWTAGA